MRRNVLSLLCAASVSLTVAMPCALAQQPEAAQQELSFKELVQQGAKAYQAKEFEEAADLFKQAYAKKATPNLLYNIGRTNEKLGNFDEAVEYYERFVNEPDVDLKARQDALARLKTLRDVIALREEGKEKEAAELQRQREESELAAAETRTVEEPDYMLSYIFLGAGGATLVGSGVFALLASGAHSDYEAATSLTEKRDFADSGETYSIVADSLLVTGVVLTGVGVYFLLDPPTETVEQDAQPAPTARISPKIGVDGSAGMTFTLDF